MSDRPTILDHEPRHSRRAVLAATVGTAIEWYDFYIYGLASALVFGQLFFPSSDPYAGTMLALSTFFVGFVARPIGALVFGHLGDRVGRKSTLIATLVLMGAGTALVGITPTYETAGIWGAVMLVILRVVQGVGVGGEWGGAVLMSTEWRTFRGRRGLTGSLTQFGSPAGMLLASGTIALVHGALTEAQFLAWGWRVPFLVSIVLVGVGFLIRIGVQEPPTFTRLQQARTAPPSPVRDALRGHWRTILLTCLMRAGQHGPFYIFTTFILAYGTNSLGLDNQFLLTAVLAASAVSLVSTPLWGLVSDRVGRKNLYLAGVVTMFAFALPYFGLLNSGSTALVVLAVILSLVVHDMQYAPQAAYIAESFPVNVRYTGSSLGYQLSSITSGGPAGLIATYLVATFGSSLAVAAYIMGMSVIGFVATMLLPDRSTTMDDADEAVLAGADVRRRADLDQAKVA